MNTKTILLICALTVMKAFAQDNNGDKSDTLVLLKLKINCSKNAIWVTPTIILKSENGKFEIDKKIEFEEDINGSSNMARVSIHKIIQNILIDLSMPKAIGVDMEDSIFERKVIHVGENNIDSFPLNRLMPFDKGKYAIKIEIDYYQNGQKKTAKSEYIQFEATKNYTYKNI